MGMKYEIFQRAKQAIRTRPDLTDEQIAEFIGAKLAELEIVREARKDVQADTPTEVKVITPEVSA